jgi:hypothetical protein
MVEKAILFFSSLILGMVTFAAPTVTDVVAKQRYPWNGLVDITCSVSGIDETIADRQFVLSAVFPDSKNPTKMSKFWLMRDGVKSSNPVADTNGDYHLLWDAKADLGEVRYTNMVVKVDFTGRPKVQLWKDGPYWATMNIGAEKPVDYGYYFWWGDTVGYKRENEKWVASDGSNSNFAFEKDNALTYDKDIATLRDEGWIITKNETYVLAPEHDAARKHWGGDWRMPTKQELTDLFEKCTRTWTTRDGVNGCVFRGSGEYASNSIFLPASGSGEGTLLYHAGSSAVYVSSDSDKDNYLWYIVFDWWHAESGYGHRYTGRSVRPVQGFTK